MLWFHLLMMAVMSANAAIITLIKDEPARRVFPIRHPMEVGDTLATLNEGLGPCDPLAPHFTATVEGPVAASVGVPETLTACDDALAPHFTAAVDGPVAVPQTLAARDALPLMPHFTATVSNSPVTTNILDATTFVTGTRISIAVSASITSAEITSAEITSAEITSAEITSAAVAAATSGKHLPSFMEMYEHARAALLRGDHPGAPEGELHEFRLPTAPHNLDLSPSSTLRTATAGASGGDETSGTAVGRNFWVGPVVARAAEEGGGEGNGSGGGAVEATMTMTMTMATTVSGTSAKAAAAPEMTRQHGRFGRWGTGDLDENGDEMEE
jgi:hypothetical protein